MLYISYRTSADILTFVVLLSALGGCGEVPNPSEAPSENSSLREAPQALLYNGHDYLFIRSARTWWEATAICEGFAYGLVTIDDAAEQAWLDSLGNGDRWWIGYNDQVSEGIWRWSHGSSSYTNWHSGEPNNAGNNEDCTEITGTGRWNDFPCSASLYFICESGP